MGRELRRVPPNWEHPKRERYGRVDYAPMHERSFKRAAKEWDAENRLWQKGKHPDQLDGSASDCEFFEEWHGQRPDPTYYVPYDPEDKRLCTWYQLYETVSEGTPVTPAFEKPEDLVEYLTTKGDFWQQNDKATGRATFRGENYSRKAAENMVFGSGWAPSGVFTDGQFLSGTEAMPMLKQTKGTV